MKINEEINIAERKAIDSLARYKFMQFGYWAAVWVHLSRLDGQRRVNPFARLVVQARIMRGDRPSDRRDSSDGNEEGK